MFVGQPQLIGPLYAEDSSGNPLPGLDFTGGLNFFTMVSTPTSSGTWGTPAGTLIEPGGTNNGKGYYWYLAASSDCVVTGTVTILINGLCQQFSWKEDVEEQYLDAKLSSIIAAAGLLPVSTPQPQRYGIVTGDYGNEDPMPITVVGYTGIVDLSDATDYQLRWLKPDGTVAIVSLTAVALPSGELERIWTSGDTAQVGVHRGQVIITWPDSTTSTYPQDGTYYTWRVYPILTTGAL